jgi:hypothetical protein
VPSFTFLKQEEYVQTNLERVALAYLPCVTMFKKNAISHNFAKFCFENPFGG